MNIVKFDAIVLNPIDNVGTSIKMLKENSNIILKIENKLSKFILKDDINLCHKFSLNLIKKGNKIIKYGEVIGVAIADIKKGKHVHVHNIKSLRG
ncbi:UxaA family hydrolase [Alphaproteobacteria bacterium]|jgi:altronate dehydratase small subunit|nr:UxaA family hydrolase [Alphaproteobacteria bacterium]|tara:strand:+ start:143 stop:427 length:285 start_codon:yes stop_codon:yes gene_type:complete